MFREDKECVVQNIVRDKRTKLGMKQDELAEKVHVTRQTIISIEKGNYTPSVLLALRLASALDTKVEELFYYEEL